MRGLSLVAASGGHSSSRCAGLSLSRPLLLQSTGSRRAGSVVVAHGRSCSAACGIFPDQGSNPVSPALAGRLSTTAPPGKPPILLFLWHWRNGHVYQVSWRGIALMGLKNLIFYFMDICFDPFLPGHPNWVPSQGIQCAKPSKYIHTLFVFVYFSIFKHEINS